MTEGLYCPPCGARSYPQPNRGRRGQEGIVTPEADPRTRSANAPRATLAPGLQSVLNAVGLGVRDAVVGMQGDGEIVTWNHRAEEIFGYRADEVLGTALDDHFAAGEGRKTRLIPAGGFLPGRPARFRTKAGAEFEAILTLVQISPDGENRMGSIAVITKPSPLEVSLEEEVLQRLEENIVHLMTLNDRIRNPLQVIAASACLTDGDVRDRILHQVEAINEVVRQLDRGDLESTAVREYLRKHCRIQSR